MRSIHNKPEQIVISRVHEKNEKKNIWKKLMATDLIKVTENDARPVAKCPVACFAVPKQLFAKHFFVLCFSS